MENVNKMFPHIAGYEAIKEECAQAVVYSITLKNIQKTARTCREDGCFTDLRA